MAHVFLFLHDITIHHDVNAHRNFLAYRGVILLTSAAQFFRVFVEIVGLKFENLLDAMLSEQNIDLKIKPVIEWYMYSPFEYLAHVVVATYNCCMNECRASYTSLA